MNIEPIARIRCDFPTKFGLPRQSGLNDRLLGEIVFEKKFRNPDAIRGLDAFSHIWLIWAFSIPEKQGWQATVRPPRLGGNERIGVFATRSPFRPNPLGLTVVKLEKVATDGPDAPYLVVSGADMMNGTEIFDIKPYIPYADIRENASGSFAQSMKDYRLKVDFPAELLDMIPIDKQSVLIAALEGDPRPAYQSDPERVYGFLYAGFDVRFRVKDGVVAVTEIISAG